MVECFAFVDGLVRENDDHDPCLGRRAAEIALRIAGELIDVSDHELDFLGNGSEGGGDGQLSALWL